MFCELLWQQISVNQRSVDNAHLEIVELCPASHRPLLTKVVHVWLDLATIREVWVRRSGYVLYNREPIRPKSSQDFMNGTTTGQSSNGQSQHAHKGAVLVQDQDAGDAEGLREELAALFCSDSEDSDFEGFNL